MHILLITAAVATERLSYRESDPALGAMLFKALLLTAGLLALALGLLLLARRFGWLPAAARANTVDGMKVMASRRITPHTSVFVIRHDGQDFLLTESSRQVTLLRANAAVAETESGE